MFFRLVSSETPEKPCLFPFRQASTMALSRCGTCVRISDIPVSIKKVLTVVLKDGFC